MRNLFVASLVVAALFAPSSDASVQSNEVILKRLDALEKENAALRQRVRRHEGGATSNASTKPTLTASPLVSPKAAAAYAMSMPKLFNWTGAHVGLPPGTLLGSRTGFPGDFPFQRVNGWLGGVSVGYDHQFANNWVLGVEADISAADIKYTENGPFNATPQRIDFISALRGRFGYAWD
jgi:opacity protein-like surface antigen